MDGLIRLCTQTAVLTERTGEDATGAATTRVTTHASSSFVEYTARERLSPDGSTRSGSGFAVFLPTGYGVTWSVKPGDDVTLLGTTRRVTGVTAARTPDGAVHHVEVECA